MAASGEQQPQETSRFSALSDENQIRCVRCKNKIGYSSYLFNCLHSTCENCSCFFKNKGEKCHSCNSEVGSLLAHWPAKNTPPTLSCSYCKPKAVAEWYCFTSKLPLCQKCCSSQCLYNSCKVSRILCPVHSLVWAGYDVTCESTVCMQCCPNFHNVHAGHTWVPFETPQMKEMRELETSFQNQLHVFCTFKQQFMLVNNAFNIDDAMNHCTEIVSVLKVARESANEKRLACFKKRGSAQLKRYQEQCVLIKKQIDSYINQISSSAVRSSTCAETRAPSHFVPQQSQSQSPYQYWPIPYQPPMDPYFGSYPYWAPQAPNMMPQGLYPPNRFYYHQNVIDVNPYHPQNAISAYQQQPGLPYLNEPDRQRVSSGYHQFFTGGGGGEYVSDPYQQQISYQQQMAYQSQQHTVPFSTSHPRSTPSVASFERSICSATSMSPNEGLVQLDATMRQSTPPAFLKNDKRDSLCSTPKLVIDES